MPAPLAAAAAVIAAATAAIYATYQALPDSVKDITKEEFERAAKPHMDSYLKSVMSSALERIGLPLDPEQGITPKSITDAINAGPLAGTGIELTNVFDKEQCKKDLIRIGLRQAAAAYGVELKDTSAEGLKAAIKEQISTQINEQLAEGAGPWLDLCPDLVDLSRELASAVRRGLIDGNGNLIEPELASDEYHVNLRERQARYRQGHSRHWEPGIPGAQS